MTKQVAIGHEPHQLTGIVLDGDLAQVLVLGLGLVQGLVQGLPLPPLPMPDAAVTTAVVTCRLSPRMRRHVTCSRPHHAARH